MWSTKIDSVPFPVVDSKVPLPTDIVKSVPVAKPFEARNRWNEPLIKNKLNTPCSACNEGIDKRTSSIGIVYHNGFGLCKNDTHTMEAESRVNAILHAERNPVTLPTRKFDIPKPQGNPFPMPNQATTIPVGKPF